MIQHLKSIIFNFDDTRYLSEAKHKEAFIDIFVQVVLCLNVWFGNIRECFVRCDSEIALLDRDTNIPRGSKGFCYRIYGEQLLSSSERFASAIYLSNNDYIVIHIPDSGSQGGFDVKVAMDPIYFGITRAAPHSFSENLNM